MTSLDAQFIDRIVREVVRRITDQAPAAQAGPSSSTALSVPSATTPPGTLVLDERLITLSQLQDRLTGVQRLIIRSDAVVTPSVRDLLREKQVQLEQTSAGNGRQASMRGLLAVCGDAGWGNELADVLGDDEVQWQTFRDVETLLRQLPQLIAQQPALALIVTPAWAHLVCRANRHANVRAVAPADAVDLDHACQQLDINLLVLDSTRLDRAQILDLGRMYIRRCLATGPRDRRR